MSAMARRLLFILPLLFAAASRGQTTQPAATSPAADSMRVYLVTLGPGNEVWEKFGHNMIWIHDPAGRPGGTDAAYNWGLFDFDSHFMVNFLRKTMRYWMDAYSAEAVIDGYIGEDRSLWLQELNLTPDQKEQLLRNVEINRLPQNKFYDYDYYLANCSTKVRDALDLPLGGIIRAQLEPVGTGATYRWHDRRLMGDDWPAHLALEYVQGPYVDRKLNEWQDSFLPVKFMEHLRHVSTPNGPLVLSERALHISKNFTERTQPPKRFIPLLIVGVLLGAGMCGFGFARNKWLRRLAASLIFFWSLVGTLAGIILLYFWFFTPHAPTARNENILLLHPLMAGLLVMVPMFRRMAKPAMILGLVIAALSVLAVLINLIPFFTQVNDQMLALIVPANLGLATGLYFAYQRQSPWPKPNPQPKKRSRVSPSTSSPTPTSTPSGSGTGAKA
jgi:hypothetical protein